MFEVWTNNRHSKGEEFVEFDHELAVTEANVTEGAARSTAWKVTQKEPRS